MESSTTMKLYKLTDAKGQTCGGCEWGPGVEHTASGKGELCGPGWLHATTDPLLALLLDPIQGSYLSTPGARLWEAEGDIGKTDHGLKVGCRRLRTVREIPVPEITTEQRVRFGILCARQVYHDPAWLTWAEGWLSGADRSQAEAVEAEAAAAAEAAERLGEGLAALRGPAAAAKLLDLVALAREACNLAAPEAS